MPVNPQPAGYHSVTPYLTVKDGAAAIAFYEQALRARVRMRMNDPGGRLMHCELQIGDSVVMLSEEFPQMGALSPQTLGGVTGSLLVYVPDVDAAFQHALDAGGKEERPLQTQFYGDRSGTLIDPQGHKWTLATHVEEVTPEQL